MEADDKTKNPPEEPGGHQHRIRLPGFLIEEEIGLGDAIKRITYRAGIKPCEGCERRAAVLNGWMRFSPKPAPKK